jgi:uncharacterized DUF497 family protein
VHTLGAEIEWDPSKAEQNRRKHHVDFADAATVFEDEFGMTQEDARHGEQRFMTVAADALGRVLVVVYCWRGERIRLISARRATPRERSLYEERA